MSAVSISKVSSKTVPSQFENERTEHVKLHERCSPRSQGFGVFYQATQLFVQLRESFAQNKFGPGNTSERLFREKEQRPKDMLYF